MPKRKYLLRIAENPQKVLGTPGKFSTVVGAGLISVPTTGDLLSALPGGGTISNFSTSYLTKEREEQNVEELLATLPKGELAAVAFNNLHFTARISNSKSSRNTSEPCVIAIYNLNEESIRRIKPEATVILQAGYTDNKELPVIYAGQIVRVETSINGVDSVTKIYCNAGYTIKKNVQVAKSFPPGKTYRDIIKGLLAEANKVGIPLGAFYEQPQVNSWFADTTKLLSLRLKSGYNATGYLLDELTDICDWVGFRVYTVLGKLYVEPKEYSKNLEIYSLDLKDVIGSIQPSKDASKAPTGDKNVNSGLRVTTFLDGRITLNKKVNITEGDYKGYYDIDDMSINLSYEGTEWYMNLNLVGITGG